MKRTAAAFLSTALGLAAVFAPQKNPTVAELDAYAKQEAVEVAKQQERDYGMVYRKMPKIVIERLDENRVADYDFNETIRLNSTKVARPQDKERIERNKRWYKDPCIINAVLAHEMSHFYYTTHITPKIGREPTSKLPDMLISEGFANVIEETKTDRIVDCEGFYGAVITLEQYDNDYRRIVYAGTCIARPVLAEYGMAGIYVMAAKPPNRRGCEHPSDYRDTILLIMKKITDEGVVGGRP